MANATGRRTAPIILSSEERSYLERQVRRRRVARSLSERCHVILRCADGSSSKSLLMNKGSTSTPSGSGVGDSCGSRRRPAGRGSPRKTENDRRRSGGRRDRAHAALDAEGCDALVDPFDGGRRPGFRTRRYDGFGALSA